MSNTSDFSKIIADMKNKGLFNEIKTVESEQGAYLKVNGKKYLNFSSNNYLGMASDKRVKKAAIDAIEKYGIGTTSVRALIGTNNLHISLEAKLAAFKGTDDAIVVTGGYVANMAAIQTILGKEDIVISDELNHASIIDAIRLAGIENKFIYKHADMDHLRAQSKDVLRLLAEPKKDGSRRKALIVTDGVFSMDGDIAPLPEIVEIAQEWGTMVMVDDAHGEGVLGSYGRGIVDHFGLHGKVDIEVGTLSKAFGVLGGFITGNKDLIQFYKQKARQFLFTNALSIPDTAALIAAVDIMDESDSKVKKLWENTNYLKDELKKVGFNTGKSETPIIPIMIGNENKAKDFAAKLYDKGIMATAIKFPMVPMGTARLRLQPSANHDIADLNLGLEKINEVGMELGVIA